MVLHKRLSFNGFAMKSTYTPTNNNNNSIKPTRANRIALDIMQDAHPDMGFRFNDVRAFVSVIMFNNPKYSDAAVRASFYSSIMNDMFTA